MSFIAPIIQVKGEKYAFCFCCYFVRGVLLSECSFVAGDMAFVPGQTKKPKFAPAKKRGSLWMHRLLK